MSNKPYSNNDLSRKIYWSNNHKKRKSKLATRYKDSYWWSRGYTYKNEGTDREFVTVVSYTKRDNNINEGKYLRRQCNKKIRRMSYKEIENMNYSLYKKTFDYWWSIC
jgi:hypothetical protein